MYDPELKRAAAQADLCRLLAACFYQPGPEFGEEDVFGAMEIAARDAQPAVVPLVRAMGEDFAKQPMQALQVDYTALFLNPSGALASPYESAWIGGKDPMVAEQTVQSVMAFYSDAGFTMDAEFRDLPDHIAAELELLYALVFREARALAGNDKGDAATAADLRRRFVRMHLGRWAGDLAGAMRSNAGTVFFRTLADATEHVVNAARV